jgi:DNA recombination protein RmuC
MDPIMIEAVFGAVILILLVALFLQLRRVGRERERAAALESRCENIPKLEAELQASQGQREKLQYDIRVLQGDRDRLSEKASRVEILERTLDGAKQRNEDLYAKNQELNAQLRAEQDNFERVKNAREELAHQFEAISKQVLASNNTSFLTLAEQKFVQHQQAAQGDLEKRQQAIGEMLSPLHTKLREFELKVDEVYRIEAAERNTLKGEISRLFELNQQLSKDASSLALALKGDTKKQGNWGELILEKVLEYSGLRKGDEYKLQVNLRNEDGALFKPDAVVFLPDKKHVLIDAKVSLVAYDRYVASATDEERSSALLEHLTSVKRHIQELSSKDYPSLAELDAPDFTLLFMPIESSFGLAIQADNELFGYAWERKIVIVSPSTLLATLRTIASIWKQERQTRNAIDIADRAGKMYDKFVGFMDDLVVAGKRLNDAKSSYDEAMKKLSTGPGNLVRQSEQLKEMGAKASKQLPGTLLDRAGDVPELPVAAGGQPSLL